MKVELVSVGSLNVDLIAFMDRFPAPGETLLGSSFEMGPGGKGANQCACAARLSGGAAAPSQRVAMLGAVGDDVFGSDYIAKFRESGVDVSLVKVEKGVSTGVAPIFVDAKAENCIVVVGGANNRVTPDDVERGLAGLPALRAVLLQLEIPLDATLAALRAARARGALSFFTPAPVPTGGLPAEFITLASVIVPNAGEARQLAGAAGAAAGAANAEAEATEAGAALIARGARAVCVTLGAGGVLLMVADGRQELVRAPRVVRPVDTTGAGDAFSGALAFFYLEASPAESKAAADVDFDLLVEAARRACYVAAVAVTSRGTQSSYPNRADLPPALFGPGVAELPPTIE